MIKLPVVIKFPARSLKTYNSVYVDNGIRKIFYVVDDYYVYQVKLPEGKRLEPTEEIMAESEKFVNGFKAVVTKNGEYAYICEEDNCLLPFRYDIAGNFNEHGYAMVGKNANISWINKEFKYFSRHGLKS